MKGNNALAAVPTYRSIALTSRKMNDYAMSLEYYQRALDMVVAAQGEDSKDAVNLRKNIQMTQYLQALSNGKLKGFMANHCITATVLGGENAASAQGLSGEYILLAFADWNQDSEQSLFSKVDELLQSPKDLVLMKDGVVSRHHFENRLGFNFAVKQVTKDEKHKINQAYKQWLELNGE